MAAHGWAAHSTLADGSSVISVALFSSGLVGLPASQGPRWVPAIELLAAGRAFVGAEGQWSRRAEGCGLLPHSLAFERSRRKDSASFERADGPSARDNHRARRRICEAPSPITPPARSPPFIEGPTIRPTSTAI